MKWNAIIRITSQTANSSAGKQSQVRRRKNVEDLEIDWESLSPDDRRMVMDALDPHNYIKPLHYCELIHRFTGAPSRSFCDEPECADCDLFADQFPRAVWVCCLCRTKGLVDLDTGERISFEVVDGYYSAGHCESCGDWAILRSPLLLEEVQ